MDSRREEKLAQARRKLREYQQDRRKSAERNASPPASSMHNGRQSAHSLPGTGFYHDDYRSPFERVRTRSECSQSSTSIAASVREEANGNNGMNSSVNGSASNLTTALLLPSRDGQDLVSNADSNGNTAVVIPMESSSTATASSSIVEMPSSTTDTSDYFTRLINENRQLKHAINEAQDNCRNMNLQLQQLHGYYTQLHSAYEAVSSSRGANASGNEASERNSLQQTVAVLVEEKTQLQSQLRQTVAIANAKVAEMDRIQTEMKTLRDLYTTTEREMSVFRSERDALSKTLSAQKEELERRRRDASQSEARVFEILQDRNDAQARLKAKCQDTERLTSELEALRKQLSMQDIYIKQLSHHSAGLVEYQAMHDALSTVNNEKMILEKEIARTRDDAERWRKETQLAKQQYEQYGRQMNDNVLQLSTKLDQVSEEKRAAESRIASLEIELQAMNAEKARKLALTAQFKDANADEDIGVRLAEAHLEIADARKAIDVLHAERASMQEEWTNLRQLNESMRNEILESQAMLERSERKVAHLEEQLNRKEQSSEDSRALATALQSEKATVSRAVAQNRELKEQLQELQERFVTVSQQAADEQNRAETLAHANAQLANVVAQDLQLQSRVPSGSASHECQDEDANEIADELREDSRVADRELMLERELAATRMELVDCRHEAARVMRENEELHRIMQQNAEDENQNTIHVELSNALARINDLDADNRRLRAEQEMQALRMDGNARGNEESGKATSSSSCQDHDDLQSQNAALRTSMSQLETRFVDAMRQNADLSERNLYLEHLITQLQSETDTIGEYVTIYQHQRRVIRDRLRERDDAVAKLSRDKESIQAKLMELHDLVMRVLGERGLLHAYEKNGGIARRGRASSPSGSSARPRPRSFSHSTVDELSGDEQTLVDGCDQEVPLPDIHQSPTNISDCNAVNGVGDGEIGGEGDVSLPGASLEAATARPASHVSSNFNGSHAEMSVDRILRIISELQDPKTAHLLPVIDPNLHCRECRGQLITL